MRKINKSILIRKLGLWIIFSIILVITYFIGYGVSIINSPLSLIFGFLIILLFSIIMLLIAVFYLKKSKISTLKRIIVWIMLFMNAFFAFLIGFSIPTMETAYRENMGYVMIPLLILLNYIIVERFYYYLEERDIEKIDEVSQNIQISGKKRPVIEYEGRKYYFSIASIFILAIGAPLLAWFIYIFFDNVHNYWLHEIVVKQTAFFLRLLFNMDIEVVYNPIGIYHWGFSFPTRVIDGVNLGSINFETFCTGIQAICVFAGIIVFTPHSKDPLTKKDVVWRKTKSLIVSSALFYVVNIIRMLIQLQLYYIGYRWEDIHYSISAASSFIAAIIVLLLHKWIPEFIITIIYVGTLISEPLKARRKERIISEIENSNKVNLNLVRKVIGMKSRVFNEKFKILAKKFNFVIEEQDLIVPNERKNDFLDALDKKFEHESKELNNFKN